MCCSTDGDRNCLWLGLDMDMGMNGVWAMRLVTAVAVGSTNHE